MANLFGVQNIARTGLMAQQQALAVTGNNIANVNTEGYSRQRPNFEALKTGGVHVLQVQRLRDSFIDLRMRESNARLGSREVLSRHLQLLETTLAESDDSGISKSLQDFFSSLRDMAVKPAGTAERELVRSRGELLAANLRSAANQIEQIRSQVDRQIRNEIQQVNSLLTSISELNNTLLQTPPNQDRNSLLDQRDRAINQLTSHLAVRVLEAENGTVTLLGEGGLTLVEGQNAYQLVALSDASNRGFARVGIRGSAGGTTIIQQRLTEGSLGALVQSRDSDSLELLNKIERMAAELVRSFNAQHRQGTGLDGVDNRDFFTGLDVTAAAELSNSGGAFIATIGITDEAALTFNDYEIRFTSATAYDVVDATTGATLSAGNVYTSGSTITFDGISVSISDGGSGPAVGDVFSVNTYQGTAGRMGLSASVAASIDAIGAGLSASPGDNENAQALAALQQMGVLGSGNGLTFEDYYNSARSQLGLAVQSANNALAGEEISQFQIRGLADAASGVSINEEAANLVLFQRAFEASSRLVSITDELLRTIINM